MEIRNYILSTIKTNDNNGSINNNDTSSSSDRNLLLIVNSNNNSCTQSVNRVQLYGIGLAGDHIVILVMYQIIIKHIPIVLVHYSSNQNDMIVS
jgi:hypothetical protein